MANSTTGSPARTLIALALLALLPLGCGGPPPNAGTTIAAAEARGRALQFGLGGNLTGLRRMRTGTPAATDALPRQVDLRRWCSPVGYQGKAGACSAFTIVDGLAEFALRKRGTPEDLSPGFLWNLVRHREGEISQNAGIDFRIGLRTLIETGAPLEQDFPWPEDDAVLLGSFLNLVPSDAVLAKAAQHRPLTRYEQILTTADMKRAVADGKPVAFGIMAYDSVYRTGPDGAIPMPVSGDRELGGHVMLCVGYDEDREHLIMRNSWGPAWGDRGYGYLPYRYLELAGYEGATASDL